MSEHDTLARIRRIIAANRDLPADSVSYEARLQGLLGPRARCVPVNSTKAAHGHAMGASLRARRRA